MTPGTSSTVSAPTALASRSNVVLTRDPAWAAEGAETAASIDEVLDRFADVWVIGGAGVYTAFLPYAELVVRTEIDLAVAGDTRAPELGGGWRSEPGDWQANDGGPRYRVIQHTRVPAHPAAPSGRRG